MNIQGVLKMHYRDKNSWFIVPNLILFSVFLLNFIISFLIPSDDKFYSGGGVSYIIVYMLILGILVVTQTFPYAIGMSIRRTDYFLGTVVMGVVTNIMYAILLVFLSAIEKATNGWGGQFHYFHFPYLNDGTILEQFTTYIILFIHLFFLGFLLSSLIRRFGVKGILIVSISFILISSTMVLLITYYGAWMNIFQWFANQTAVEIAYWLILPTLLYLCLPYLLLRRATV